MFAAGLFVGEKTQGGGDDGDTGSGEGPGNIGNTSVATNTWFANALDRGQNRFTFGGVVEGELEGGRFAVLLGQVFEVAGFDENLSKRFANAGTLDGDDRLLGEVTVSDGGKKVCDGIHISI